MLGNNQSPSQDMTPNQKHDAIMQQLDEIKRYVAGTFSKVDTEIDELRKIIDRVDKQVRDNDQQIDRIANFEQSIRNIESTLRDIQRKVK